MAQSIAGVISGLYTAAPTIFNGQTGADGQPIGVTLGPPGQYVPHSVFAVGMDIRMPISRPTMSPSRSREQVAEIDSILSVYVPGGEEAQLTANAAALTLQGLVETYLRTAPNETFGGACRDSFVSNCQLAAAIAWQRSDDPTIAPAAAGRIAAITVTVTAFVRY